MEEVGKTDPDITEFAKHLNEVLMAADSGKKAA